MRLSTSIRHCKAEARACRRDAVPAGFVPRAKSRGEKLVLDVILIAAALVFFALSIAYAFGCEHL
jgi:hypothetical protein